MRPPRSGWTITYFTLLGIFVIAAALGIISDGWLFAGTAALIALYFVYQKLAR
jgi:hypothetical protein